MRLWRMVGADGKVFHLCAYISLVKRGRRWISVDNRYPARV